MARIGKAVSERGTVLTCSRLLRSEWRGDARRLVITPSTSTLCLQHSRNGGGWHNRRRPGDQLYEPAEVLCDRCQRELELGPARPFPLIWASPVAVMPFVEQGKVKMLAVSTQQRDRMLPQVPTVCESGVPGFDTANWFGVVAPARAPSEVVARVGQAIREASELPDVEKRMSTLGFNIDFRNSDQFREMIVRDHQKYGTIIREAGIQPD